MPRLNPDLIVFGIYLAVVTTVGFVASRRQKRADDYFLASRNLTWWLIGGSMIAANISTHHFIGMSGLAFDVGLAIASFEWMAALALILYAKFFLPHYLKTRITTMPEFLERRLELGSAIGFFEDLGENRTRDVFGVVWDRSVDKDIGIVEGCVLPEPTLANYRFPDPLDRRFFADIPAQIARYPNRFRVFYLGFSLFERAWTLRGMENLLLDFIEHPGFVHDLLTAITDYNLAQVREALRYDIDAVYFGDDWGQQHGLIMGKAHWNEFIRPQLRRMYGLVREAGKFQMIHSSDERCRR
jgi:hypothetical protein